MASDMAKSFELLEILARGQPRAAHVVKMCNTRETHVVVHVPAVIKTWGDAVRRERGLSRTEHSHRAGVMRWYHGTENSVCLAAYHWQMDFSAYWMWFAVLRQCFSSGTAADGHTPYKSKAKPKLTKNYHLRPRPPVFHNFLYVI